MLKVSFAMKELPLFALVVAKDGFKCTNATDPMPLSHPCCTSLYAFSRTAATARALTSSSQGYVPPMPGHEWPGKREQAMHWAPHGWPFWLLAAFLSNQPELDGRMMVDKTGLDGAYDCDVSWAREGTDVPGPSFFTAIQEQIGLKLVPEKDSVETLVVDSVERPSEN